MKKLYKWHAIYKNKEGKYKLATIRTYEPEILEAFPVMYELLKKKEEEFSIYSLTAASDWEENIAKKKEIEFDGVF